MSEDDERLISGLSEILTYSDDDRSLGGGLSLPFAVDAAAIRRKTGLSQAAFAKRINVPVATLRNWEQGHRSPQGPTRVLLAFLDRNSQIVEEILGRAGAAIR